MDKHKSVAKKPISLNRTVEKEVSEDKLRPNFSKAELETAVLPKRIAKEIRLEKYRILIMNLLGTGLLIASTFFILAWFLAEEEYDPVNGIMTKWLVPTDSLPNPGFMFVLLAIGLILFIISLIEYAHIIGSVNRYKADILMKVESVPYFLIKSYRAIVARSIYINWICGSIYVGTGITIGILFAISGIKPEMAMTTEKNISYTILGLSLAFHIGSLILIKFHKGNLNSFYGKDLISLDEQREIRKVANKRCLITFCVIVGIILVLGVIPWMLVRKKKGLKPIPFF